MSTLSITTSPEFKAKFSSYPSHIRPKMDYLRELVIETAKELPEVDAIEETLKWGEPAFVSAICSTLRIDWKERTPEQYQMYFMCSTRLVETFKVVFGDIFDYEKNRALVFRLDDEVPTAQLKECIGAALMYQRVKRLETLGL